MSKKDIELPTIELETRDGSKKVTIEATIKNGLAVHRSIEFSGWQISHAEAGCGLMTAIPDRKLALILCDKLSSFGDWESLENWTVKEWFKSRQFIDTLCQFLSCVATADTVTASYSEAVRFLSLMTANAVTELATLKGIDVVSCYETLNQQLRRKRTEYETATFWHFLRPKGRGIDP